MKRAALDRFRAVRDSRRYHALHALVRPVENKLAPGYFRKGRRISGCSTSKCWLCHAGKLGGHPDIQELRNDLSFREQLGNSTALRKGDNGY